MRKPYLIVRLLFILHSASKRNTLNYLDRVISVSSGWRMIIMREENFFEAVQQRAYLDSTAAVRDVTVAILQTLGEHLSEGQEDDLAPALPNELTEALIGAAPRPAESFSFEEFIERVSNRAGLDESDALQQSRVVFTVLAETVGYREIQGTQE